MKLFAWICFGAIAIFFAVYYAVNLATERAEERARVREEDGAARRVESERRRDASDLAYREQADRDVEVKRKEAAAKEAKDIKILIERARATTQPETAN